MEWTFWQNSQLFNWSVGHMVMNVSPQISTMSDGAAVLVLILFRWFWYLKKKRQQCASIFRNCWFYFISDERILLFKQRRVHQSGGRQEKFRKIQKAGVLIGNLIQSIYLWNLLNLSFNWKSNLSKGYDGDSMFGDGDEDAFSDWTESRTMGRNSVQVCIS